MTKFNFTFFQFKTLPMVSNDFNKSLTEQVLDKSISIIRRVFLYTTHNELGIVFRCVVITEVFYRESDHLFEPQMYFVSYFKSASSSSSSTSSP